MSRICKPCQVEKIGIDFDFLRRAFNQSCSSSLPDCGGGRKRVIERMQHENAPWRFLGAGRGTKPRERQNQKKRYAARSERAFYDKGKTRTGSFDVSQPSLLVRAHHTAAK